MSGEGDPRLGDIRPVVAAPRDVLSMPVILAIIFTVALGLFLTLDTHRRSLLQAEEHGAERAVLLQAAPPLAVPPLALPSPAPPSPAPPSSTPLSSTPLSPSPQPRIIREIPKPEPVPNPIAPPLRMFAPTPPIVLDVPRRPVLPRASSNREGGLMIDLTAGNPVAMAGERGSASGEGGGTQSDEPLRATLIRNRGSVMPQGAIISAVLETPLNSDRPGLARAIVTQDARGFDGSRVLIPRGSRLIGDFKADNGAGKRRVLVTWSRLIRPDGVAIRIGSPATDAMGGAGIAGSVNTHFAEHFASAVLQTALAIGVNAATSELGRSSSTIYVGAPGQFSNLGQQMVPNTNRPATVKVREGAEIAVLVARDLDFSGTPAVR